MNIDGINKNKIFKRAKPHRLNCFTLVMVDSIVKRPKAQLAKTTRPPRVLAFAVPKEKVLPAFARQWFLVKRRTLDLFRALPEKVFQGINWRQKFSLAMATVVVFLAFGAGMWTELATPKTSATDSQSQTGADNFQIPLPGAQYNPQPTSVSNDILFNTPLEYLKNYLASVAEPDIIENRKDQLAAYLTEKNSPLASAAETIAQQPHWQLILAIAFAESTLGKNCTDNNCSNIGVKPGAPSWRRYASYQNWVVDFNRLLDKKYKDQTLEQMCGVYVQPCSTNWLLATKQVLGELKDKGIE
jgi:hypothetical protein